MENSRISRWLATLHILDKLDMDISIVVKQLAKLDNKLIEWSKKHDPRSRIEKGTLDDFEEYLTISYLWVLGAYEIIRTIYQRCKEQNIFPQVIMDKIKDTKDYFTRIRVPLAKLEPAKKYKNTDYSIAFPHNTKFGLGWLIGDNRCILRINLSDKFLELLELMETSDKSLQRTRTSPA